MGLFVLGGPVLDLGVCMGDGVDAHFVTDFAPEGPPCLEVREWTKREGLKRLWVENTGIYEWELFDP